MSVTLPETICDRIKNVSQATQPIYHDSSEETHRFATAGVGRHVPVAHGEEGDGDEPHSRVHVAGRYRGLPA